MSTGLEVNGGIRYAEVSSFNLKAKGDTRSSSEKTTTRKLPRRKTINRVESHSLLLRVKTNLYKKETSEKVVCLNASIIAHFTKYEPHKQVTN